MLASAVVVGFAGLNLAGAQVVGRAESVLVYFKLAVLLVFCLGGLAFVDTARVSPAAFPSAGEAIIRIRGRPAAHPAPPPSSRNREVGPAAVSCPVGLAAQSGPVPGRWP